MKPKPFPLLWPPRWPRNQSPQPSAFKTTLAKSRDGIVRQLELLGAKNIVISSNAAQDRSGNISSRQPYIEDTGVAVYFTLRGDQRCVPCDKWLKVEENLRAIELTIEALRGLERWGAKELVDAAFKGFEAPQLGSGRAEWWDVLGVTPDATPAAIETAYRAKVFEHHPDKGGDAEKFREVNDAYAAAKRKGGTS